ncbi:MAG: DUF4101 domain-containing protein [Gloeocapsa sp. DLM2.Bin57]|nr:MAG: DUF4101 domain-containing protein [Gloeocapsa sp. DLM2.Bin57]
MLSLEDFALEKHPINIPLDYYRVLGVPVQATTEQIAQAYHDRSVQLPRAEYSHKAITARQQLIRESYQILSEPQQRQNYDTKFLSSSTPEITIAPTQLAGALVILQEFGEYELVVKLSQNYQDSNLTPQENQDILLSVALANLELGRERWQQGKYEKAASFLLAGQKILAEQQICLKIQQEIQQDLCKLRPYRIIELLSLNLKHTKERQTGLNLLQEMLDKRQGIEGKTNDYSGLSLDDFLRFIQQIQSYLTVTEQQTIFEREAKRPSPVATYLAFYALLARGFAHKQPELIFRAKTLLKPLLKHQDIYLEEGVCNLLLGQTEAALQSLDKSQESATLDFIKQQSANSPDLLPGLCLYSERWLQSEVFPHFRDLTDCSTSLEDYFNDLDVQNYLNSLPQELNQQPEIIKETPIITPVSEQLFNASSLQTLQPPVKESKTTANLTMEEAVRETNARQTNKQSQILQNSNLWKIVLASLLGIGFLTIIASLWKKTTTPDSQLILSLNQPMIVIPETNQIEIPTPVVTENILPEILNNDQASIIVAKWLEAKSRAFGINHEINALNEILVDPLLSKRVEIANLVKSQNSYREYEHDFEIESVIMDENNPEKAIIIAQVREVGKYYQNERFLADKSYDSTLRVRYDLNKVDQRWLISNIQDLRSSQ